MYIKFKMNCVVNINRFKYTWICFNKKQVKNLIKGTEFNSKEITKLQNIKNRNLFHHAYGIYKYMMNTHVILIKNKNVKQKKKNIRKQLLECALRM